ncbi:MAG: methyltransferase domain-containing protein [Candidatus Zixiibacteriota bacterium]
MDQSVRTMLERLYGIFEAKFKDTRESWNHFIEFIAVDNKPTLYRQVKHKFEWLFDDLSLCKSLLNTYDPKILKGDFYDHLGDMYLEKFGESLDTKTRDKVRPPESIEKVFDMTHIPRTDKNLNILDPACGTGRLLLAAHKLAPNASYFGVESDLDLVRIAITNFSIHGLDGYFLHAESCKHETDIAKANGQYNWQFANDWNSHIHELKPVSGQNKVVLQVL